MDFSHFYFYLPLNGHRVCSFEDERWNRIVDYTFSLVPEGDTHAVSFRRSGSSDSTFEQMIKR